MMNSKLLVLVVAGEAEVRSLAFSLLDRQGFLVATRADVLDALKYASRNRPDVVLAEEGFADTDGFAREIVRVAPESRVIFISPDDVRSMDRFIVRAGGAPAAV